MTEALSARRIDTTNSAGSESFPDVSVDALTVFEEDTPLNLIQELMPDVLVKGSDYTESDVVGADLVRRRGGDVLLCPLVPGKSTTTLIRRIA